MLLVLYLNMLSWALSSFQEQLFSLTLPHLQSETKCGGETSNLVENFHSKLQHLQPPLPTNPFFPPPHTPVLVITELWTDVTRRLLFEDFTGMGWGRSLEWRHFQNLAFTWVKTTVPCIYSNRPKQSNNLQIFFSSFFVQILANAKSSAGLLEMPDIRSAMEALTLTNHFTINPPGNKLKSPFSAPCGPP